MASWWEDATLTVSVRKLRAAGRRYEDLATWICKAGYPLYSKHSIRRVFSERGWSGEEQSVATIDYEIEREQEKIETKAQKRRYKKELTEAASWATLIDVLEELVPTIPPPEPHPSHVVGISDLHLMLPFTDPHAGGYTCPDESGERFAFDEDTLEERFRYWEQGCIQFISDMQSIAFVATITIPSLGDWIENALLHRGSDRTTYTTNTQACITLADMFAKFIYELERFCPDTKIDVHMLDGNHDRMAEKGERPSHESWSTIAHALVSRMLRGHNRVRVTKHDEPNVLLRIGQSVILLHHGHAIGSSAQSSVEAWAERAASFHRVKFTHAIVGHFHISASWISNSGVHIIMCPSFADSNTYSAGRLLANRAGQKCLAFHEEGLFLEGTINLGPPIAPSPIIESWS